MPSTEIIERYEYLMDRLARREVPSIKNIAQPLNGLSTEQLTNLRSGCVDRLISLETPDLLFSGAGGIAPSDETLVKFAKHYGVRFVEKVMDLQKIIKECDRNLHETPSLESASISRKL